MAKKEKRFVRTSVESTGFEDARTLHSGLGLTSEEAVSYTHLTLPTILRV